MTCKGISLNRIFCRRAPDYACANHSLSIGGRPAIQQRQSPSRKRTVEHLFDSTFCIAQETERSTRRPFLLSSLFLTYKHINPSTQHSTRPSGIYPSSPLRHSPRARHCNNEHAQLSFTLTCSPAQQLTTQTTKDILVGPKLWSDSLLLVRRYL